MNSSLDNITGTAQLAIAVRALRIYALTFIIRGSVIIYFRYLMVIGFSGYASLISALDGFGAIIPIAWLMCHAFGTDGLWCAFPVTAALIMLFIIICNQRIAARSDGRLKGILLFEYDGKAEPILDVTITKDPASIAGISEKLQEACEKSGLNRQEAMKAAILKSFDWLISKAFIYISSVIIYPII